MYAKNHGHTDGYNKYMECIPLSPLFYKREERRVYEIIRGASLLKFSTCWCSLLIRAPFCGHRVKVYATQDWSYSYVAHAASRYKDIHAFTYIWWAYFYKEEKKQQEKQSRTQYPIWICSIDGCLLGEQALDYLLFPFSSRLKQFFIQSAHGEQRSAANTKRGLTLRLKDGQKGRKEGLMKEQEL